MAPYGVPLDFRRDSGRWAVAVAGRPMTSYPQTGGRRTLATQQTSLDGHGIVAIGSPDLRRIMVQHRDRVTRQWSAPREIARAPRGTLCRSQSYGRTHPGAVSVIACYPEDRPWREVSPGPAHVAWAVATTDGQHWDAVRLVDPDIEPVEEDTSRVVVRSASTSYVYESGYDALVPIRLPSDPVADGLALTPDGQRAVRVTGSTDRASGCRPTWAVASVRASRWPAGHRFPRLPGEFSRPWGCRAAIYRDGASYVVQVEQRYSLWQGELARRGDGFRLEQYAD